MGTNQMAIPAATGQVKNLDFGTLESLKTPKLVEAAKKDGVKGVAKALFSDEQFQWKKDEPLEAALIRSSGRNVLAVLDNLGDVVQGGVEATLGGIAAPVAGLVGMLAALPATAWITIHAASNGAEAFKRLDSAVQELRAEGKWKAHDALWEENKAAIQKNWESIKDQDSWKVAGDALEMFVTGVARGVTGAVEAPVNLGQATLQFGGGVAVGVARPLGISFTKVLGLILRPVGGLIEFVGKTIKGVGKDLDTDARALAKNTVYAKIPGLGTPEATKEA